MTQTPSDGWADGRGAMHPGFPPPGFWQATDGRWYPPELAPQQQPPPQPQYAQPQYAITPAPKKSRTVLWVVLGLVVLTLAGCTALLVAGAATVASELEESGIGAADSTDLADADTSVAEDDQATASDDTELEVVGGDEALDAGVCTRIDADNMTIEVTNNSPKTSSYFLTVGYFDGTGQRVGDTTEVLNHLRPGERSLETYFLFDAPDGECEVIEVERFAAESDPGEMDEISPCEVTGADGLGDVAATVTATNGTPKTSDYNVDVAFTDGDGIRVGSGFAFIEAVRSGESAPSEIFSALDEQPGLTCEVVAVTRNASN